MQGKTLTEIVYGEDCFSFFRVTDAVRVDREHRLSFRQTRRVVDLADSRLASAFAKVQPVNEKNKLKNTAYGCYKYTVRTWWWMHVP